MLDRAGAQECGAKVFGTLYEIDGNILLRTDKEGFIEEGSAGLGALGFPLAQMLLHPHLSDLSYGQFAAQIREYHTLAMGDGEAIERLVFPITTKGEEESWYSLCLKSSPDGSGTLGLLRPFEGAGDGEKRKDILSGQDPITQLPDRNSLQAILTECCATRMAGTLVLIGIDQFRALTLRFGPSLGDDIIRAFGQFLKTLGDPSAIIARMESDRFAVMLPGADWGEARDWVKEVILCFARISSDPKFRSTKLTASAGIAQLNVSMDSTVARAELALSVAQASGGGRSECGDRLHGCRMAPFQNVQQCLVASH